VGAMLTIFTTPKPFRGHFRIIQRNAIRSWTLLRPECEVILFGNEEGTKTIASEFGLRHIPKVEQNEHGTPLVRDLFEKAQRLAAHDVLCYVNCDIILMSDFARAVQRVAKHRFLLIGKRWNLDVTDNLEFINDWEEDLQIRLRQNGIEGHPSGIDYFVFNRGWWGDIPAFAIGRPGWDNWMLYRARCLHVTLIDATPVITPVHQNHDYSHHPQGENGVLTGDEAQRNLELLDRHGLTTEDATHLLTTERLRLNCAHNRFWRHLSTLPTFYPALRLPIRIFLKALSISHPLRSACGLTLSSSDVKSQTE